MSYQPMTALVVLSAGRSTRMGEAKALLRFGNRTLLELAVHNAVEAGLRRVVVVVGHRAEEIRAAHSFTGLPLTFHWALNLAPDSPQLVSLQIALRELSHSNVEAFLFQPVDLPLVTPDDIRKLVAAYQKRGAGERVFIPSYDNHRGHPVLCEASLIDAFLKLSPQFTARDLLDRQKIVYVETGNSGVLEDMDTREDYKRLREVFLARNRPWERGRGIRRPEVSPPESGPGPERDSLADRKTDS